MSIDDITAEEAAADPARDLRRLVAIGLVLAIAGAGAALGIFASRDGSTREPSIFPSRFSENGFVSAPVRLVHAYDAGASDTRATGELSAGTTSYLVARCDHGGIVVTAGSLTTSRPCTGRPEGVINLKTGRATTLTATVTERQAGRWGLAIYR